MNIDKSLLAGSTGMLILKLLEEKDMYGYEMIEELRRRSDHTFDFKAGTLYPLLHSLEDKCLLSSYENTQAPKKRKYYTTVSYTHLDVYKRQLSGACPGHHAAPCQTGIKRGAQ